MQELNSFFFKHSQTMTVTLSNMRLTDIPTQTRRVFIKAKHGLLSRTTEPASINRNTVMWSQNMTFQCKTSHNTKRNKLRLSFRLETGINGKRFKRYGHITIDLSNFKLHIPTKICNNLSNCKFGTKFSCSILISNDIMFAPIKRIAVSRKNVRRSSCPLGAKSSDIKNSLSCDDINTLTEYSDDQNSSTKEAEYDIDSLHVPEEKLIYLEHQVDVVLDAILQNRKSS